MKITSVELQVLRDVPLPRELRYAWAPGTVTRAATIGIVRVGTDEGIEGRAMVGPAGLPEPLRQYLIGQDPFLVEQHIRQLRIAGTAWGVEVALWDIIGKACGQPLYRLWGGYTDRIKAYASLVQVGTPEQRAEDALGFYAEGFRAIKLRLHNETVQEDLALVQAVRKAVGDRMEIMVDANQAQTPVIPSVQAGVIWDFRRALYMAQALEDLGVVWLEEPLSRYDLDGLERLSSSVSIPIAGGENNRFLHEFRWLIERGCYSIVQPDCLVSESIWQLKKIAALAEMHARLCVPHHGGGGLGTVAHLHFSCAVPNSPYLEIMRDRPGEPAWPAQQLLAQPLLPDADGYVHAPQRPGLGVELNEEMIRRYAG